ncbi:UDP-glucose 4-epimerase GalE [Fimbriiglobus ruber]|uniref:UDP-glucose 4-epimerase n=1 Tax=Fimbriiglobus ruber TaxID=1908690 RepID=A0A225E0A4_9BACT|nr:UDP-glucose 4-epimerase GalE [Fimbriiglobus ruber]OWK47031.1 UDP-glucose 4-epimerase [Fimbriiglobus ruber]
MRILVTGGAGYIGSHTVKLLLARGHDVTVFDNLSMGHKQAVPADRLVVGDLRDADQVDHLLMVNRIEAVIHFAASAFVGESVTNPAKYYQNNLLNSLNLLDRVRRQGVTRFVFSSTCATYGVPETVPITETTPQAPINPYGNTKLAFEKMLADYAPAYNIGFTALRYFNASGAAADGTIGEDHDPETHLIPIVLQAALGRRPHVEIFGTDYPTPDGTCVRDYIHVEDLAAAHLLALEHIRPGAGAFYNVGIGTGYSVREVIRTAEEVTGKRISVKEGTRRAGDPPALVAGADKIRQELGWQPAFTTLRPIVESAWNWHKAHPNGYGK